MKIWRLGHAMYVLKSKSGKNYLIDPFFDLNPGFAKELDDESFYKSIDVVFLTHGHLDHSSGLSKLIQYKPDIMIVAQYDLAMILLQKGMKNVFPINFGGSASLDDVHVTMVQALHTSSYGETEGLPVYAGEAAGYIFDFKDDYTVYHSGDTGLMLDMKLIQDFYQPDIAILSSAGQLTMGPKEAAYAVQHLLDVKYVIPSHNFPTEKTATNLDSHTQLTKSFPIVGYMMSTGKELVELLKDYSKTEVIELSFGEEREFTKESVVE
ncbi:metal-dependent hydrolase [Bacillus sp. DTU_2020_1000418_1_SI_GHA_SEK_038]|uniref:metal-dependent hydrolase n=1 Tax=Bacillus sp. DTU_2020_1000418_1_SI_GHA_SEK_038 TaxID=3077585 RepID=UPI0028E52F7C|nr:metal-dependent hydrolase [Bacillus sp. DTU_2020_1000418_1_SI_GHA_SEK_038]WNS73704.1 metal-dependent hydrolase [Bacillus sp. DTU_2020_1000418_1_SI_GHA_SEK_038]